MKAIVISEFGGPEVLKNVNVDTPSINTNQVLIRVEATSRWGESRQSTGKVLLGNQSS